MLISIVNPTVGDRRRSSFVRTHTVILRYIQESINATRQDISYEDDNDHDDDDSEASEDGKAYKVEKGKDDEQDTLLQVIWEYKFCLKEFNILLEKLPI